MKKIVITLLSCLAVASGYSQSTLSEVLESVERNNADLQTQRSLNVMQSLEARMQTAIADPEIEYNHNWGNRSELGTTGELIVSQSFEFPAAYAYRKRLAQAQETQYGHEYAAYRQQVLLSAQSVCLDIMYLRQRRELLEWMRDNALKVIEIAQKKYDAGDANILDLNKARYEYLNTNNELGRNEIEIQNALIQLAGLNGGVSINFDDNALWQEADYIPSFEYMKERYEESSPVMQSFFSARLAADEELKVSKTGSIPKYNVGYKHEFSPGEKFNGIVVGMNIPLFSNRHNVKRARAQVEYTQSLVEQTKVEMFSALQEMYSTSRILAGLINDYEEILKNDTTHELLDKALSGNHISVSEYFLQLEPIYQINLSLLENKRDYKLVNAQIKMVDL